MPDQSVNLIIAAIVGVYCLFFFARTWREIFKFVGEEKNRRLERFDWNK